MTQPTNEGLRSFQWGKEATRGTAVAATSKIAVLGIDFDGEDKLARPRLAKGLLHRYPGSETFVMRGSRFSIPASPVVYDQQHHWCSASVKGGVAAVGVGPYTYTFARSLTADPAPDAWTLERRLTDGATPIDNEWSYALLSEIAWHYKAGEELTFSAEGFARRIQGSVHTAALALPTIEIPAAALAQVWIDSSWATLGTTLVSAQVLSADVVFKTGLKPKLALDGRTDLDFSTYIFDPSECGVDVSMRILVQSAGQYATEKTAAEAGTLRAVRVKVLGTASRELTIDALLKHELGTVVKVGSEDGQDVVDLKLVDSDDGANLFSVKVVNAAATFA